MACARVRERDLVTITMTREPLSHPAGRSRANVLAKKPTKAQAAANQGVPPVKDCPGACAVADASKSRRATGTPASVGSALAADMHSCLNGACCDTPYSATALLPHCWRSLTSAP